jgi:hypothetical protein
MPNRNEIPTPVRRPNAVAAAAPDDAWPIIAFCAIGFLITIYAAVAGLGIDAIPRVIGQFYAGMTP